VRGGQLDRYLRDGLKEFFGSSATINVLEGRTGFGAAVTVETYADDPQERRNLARQQSVMKKVLAWSEHFKLDEWWDSTRPQDQPSWSDLTPEMKLGTWLTYARMLTVPGVRGPHRVLFHRSEGGLPPGERPKWAIEKFLRSQWTPVPQDRIQPILEEILKGDPTPIAIRRATSDNSRTYISPDPVYNVSRIEL